MTLFYCRAAQCRVINRLWSKSMGFSLRVLSAIASLAWRVLYFLLNRRWTNNLAYVCQILTWTLCCTQVAKSCSTDKQEKRDDATLNRDHKWNRMDRWTQEATADQQRLNETRRVRQSMSDLQRTINTDPTSPTTRNELLSSMNANAKLEG